MALFRQLPADLNQVISSALAGQLSLGQLDTLRLVNKTWKTAVENGGFGPLGRLLRPGLPRVALLLRMYNPDYEDDPEADGFALPAMGIVDAAAERIHIVPLSSESSYFDGKQTRAVLLGTRVLLFTNLKHRCSVLGQGSVSSPDVRSFDTSSGQQSWIPMGGRRSRSESISWLHFVHVYNTAVIDDHRFFVFGYRCRKRGLDFKTLHLVVIFDALTNRWQSLPPLPFWGPLRLYDVYSFSYVSRDRIWVSHRGCLFSFSLRGGRFSRWRREFSESLTYKFLFKPPVFPVELLTPVRGVPEKTTWQAAVQRAQGQLELLEVASPRKQGARRAVKGALTVGDQLLLLCGQEAYLDGRELWYSWGQGRDSQRSPQIKWSVLWAAEYRNRKGERLR
jgi:hypothetical protein